MSKLIFGCGYLGKRVARRWQSAGHNVIVVTRSEKRAGEFRQQGFEASVADVTNAPSLANLPVADTVLFSVGYDRSQPTSHQSIQDVYAGGMQNVLTALPPNVGRFIYISTTGVYGPASGDRVDEASPPDPQRDGGHASLAAEQAIAASAFAARSIILRLAGIYGPSRVPFTNELLAREPIPARGSGYINLIHVEDAADVVIAAERSELIGTGPRVYCVSDGNPAQRGAVYSEVARLISAPPPIFTEPDPNSRRATRAENSRRVCNERMLAELRVTLKYPDYRAGLAAILSS
jgi:nucleoside-diphosphate-sugar epimerase